MNGSRERDQAVERLLRQSRQSLQAPQDAGAATDSCLDAETVAAWADGGLSGAALEMAQSHVADCARCQALVGALARIHSVAPPAEPERAPRWRLAWLVPLTAAAAALALWVAVPGEKGAPLPQATEVQRQAAAVKAQEPAPLDDRSQAFASPAPASGKDEQPAAKNDVARGNQPRTLALESRRDSAGRLEADSLKQQPEASGAIASSAARVPEPAAEEARAAPIAAAPPPAAAALATPSLAEKVVGLARSAERAPRGAEAVTVEIASPDPSVRWRIAGSVVQRSTDGGSRWEELSTGVAADLTAGAAPSASVCWLVGRRGVVLLSTDGRTWHRVAFPDATDLSAVRAKDASAASVSTADGRTFNTTDGGVTWVR